jgi:hypothetical protein
LVKNWVWVLRIFCVNVNTNVCENKIIVEDFVLLLCFLNSASSKWGTYLIKMIIARRSSLWLLPSKGRFCYTSGSGGMLWTLTCFQRSDGICTMLLWRILWTLTCFQRRSNLWLQPSKGRFCYNNHIYCYNNHIYCFLCYNLSV